MSYGYDGRVDIEADWKELEIGVRCQVSGVRKETLKPDP
jgi:hypothetical protein